MGDDQPVSTPTGFWDSYLGRLRQKIGSDLLLLPGASCLFVNEAGELLLERRSDFGLWGIPGGNMEPGEDIVSSLRREMLEETGWNAADFIPYGFASDPATKTITFPNGHRCQYFVLMFWSPWPEGREPVASAESLAFGWFRPDDLPDDAMKSLPASVAAYQRFRSSGVFQMT
ncbi:8-oxo-dGTP diphosphatase [Dongia mobilis]|uniref:8-oxo-dGTP diphosphatase n=1 Tax=Dongia mobilis TaxID=578943 RepID=A0A4R6WPT2_9PROT|nr:8-oxo-dGTP diphosphatase [Dongia mobilis]